MSAATIQYIFGMNAGRSGSHYLAGLLGTAEHVVSLHEPLPIMVGAPMQSFNEGDQAALEKLMPVKVQQIRQSASHGKKIYCETNPSYIKGWGSLLLDAYIPQEEIGVIILQRAVDETAYSLLRIHEVPGLSAWSRVWWLTPGARCNLSRPPAHANPYDLCRWYVEEVRLRAAAYQERFPRITYVTCDLMQLNDYQCVVQVFDTFGLRPTPQLEDVVGRRSNPRTEWPRTPLEDLLSLPPYPSADTLAAASRDALLGNMVAYLHKHKSQEISAMKIGQYGTLQTAAAGLIAGVEHELEEVFQYTLRFTEMERILIHELIYSFDKNDLTFLYATRLSHPSIAYEYNFNIPINLKN